jgi:hypothetical protein
MAYDFNDAESNTGTGDLIPKGTVAPVRLSIRPGSVGDGGWLSTSATSSYQWLDCEFTITGGPFARRKFWTLLMAGHDTPNEEKVAKTLGITRSKLRGILESARGIDPSDMSEPAKAKRIVNGYGDFDGMEFVAKIGVQAGTGGYSDKNVFDNAVPVTSKDYAAAKAGAVSSPAAAAHMAPPPAANVPAWAAG